MPRSYWKPLRGGGSRIIPRTGGGQFTTFSLGAKVCEKCGAIILKLPPTETPGGFIDPASMNRYPDKCHQCGAEIS